MQILYQLEDLRNVKKQVSLTIGNFDGVHRGHQTLLRRMKEKNPQSHLAVLTFSNHPSTILNPDHPTLLINTLPHRIKLLEEAGIHTLFLVPFNRSISKQNAPMFIEKVRQTLSFDFLTLGYNATLGHNRKGLPSVMEKLAMMWGFDLNYVDEYRYEGRQVSSTLIRQLIQQGLLDDVENMLGRPYSIYSKGTFNNHSQISIDITGLCLLPTGNYAVVIEQSTKRTTAIASLTNLEISKGSSSLIVDLPSNSFDFIESDYIEVIFQHLAL